jgi:hypothetical protein
LKILLEIKGKKYKLKPLNEGKKQPTPHKTRIAYKLLQIKKTKPGKVFPLFIGATTPTPIGVWVPAQFIPTKGFADRPGWHVGALPIANHLKKKDGTFDTSRVWAEVEIPADVDWQKVADQSPTKDIRDEVPVGGFYRFKRPAHQGGEWLVAGAIKILRLLSW